MVPEPEQALRRIGRCMIALAGGGALALLVWRGWTWSAGWVLGCAASALNFHWLRRVTDALGDAAEGRSRDRKALLLGLRYILLGSGCYVILKYSAISLSAALAGLFVPVAAVILEIVVELVYARN